MPRQVLKFPGSCGGVCWNSWSFSNYFKVKSGASDLFTPGINKVFWVMLREAVGGLCSGVFNPSGVWVSLRAEEKVRRGTNPLFPE